MSVGGRLLIRGVNEQTLIDFPSGRVVEIPVTAGKSAAQPNLDASGDVLISESRSGAAGGFPGFLARLGGGIDSAGVGHVAPARICGGRDVTFEPRGHGAQVLARRIGEEAPVPVVEIDAFDRVGAIACDANQFGSSHLDRSRCRH